MNTEQEIIPASLTEIKPFSKFESELATMKEANDKAIFDFSTAKGIKEAKSHIFGIRKVRAALEKARKDAKADALNYGRMIDTEAKRIEGELEAMISVHETPLLEIEAKEQARKDAITLRMNDLYAYKGIPDESSTSVWREALSTVELFVVDAELAEFMAHASLAKDEALKFIRGQLALAQLREQEAAELARLRQEQAERERAEREEQIRIQAAAKATREAEDAAERKRVAAEQEAQRKEQEQAAALQRQQEATAKAEREAKEAIQRAEQAEKDAKAKAERELAAKQESERVAAEKREKDKKHHAKINNEAVVGLVSAGLSEQDAKTAIVAIAKREIPNVSIQY